MRNHTRDKSIGITFRKVEHLKKLTVHVKLHVTKYTSAASYNLDDFERNIEENEKSQVA